MPKGTSRPQLTVQHEQAGACVELPYYTEKPEPDEVQCALAWYTGAFADRERQLGVEILLDALLGTNNSPLKAALLAEKLGADIDIGFDDSTLQPVLELVLRGATEESARKFAAAVRKAVDGILAEGIPQELLLASLNAAEFASLERPGTLPDGVLDAINASTGWLHTGDPTLLLHTGASSGFSPEITASMTASASSALPSSSKVPAYIFISIDCSRISAANTLSTSLLSSGFFSNISGTMILSPP